MIEFKPFESKPIIRMAFQLNSETHQWMLLEDDTWIVSEKTENTTNFIRFRADESVKDLDWVVQCTEFDTYHCSDKVFRERNIVPE